MSANIPESIPTSSSRTSHRPTKKRALTPTSKQSAQVDALFANPDREIAIPTGPVTKSAALPPEIVANVQGSSAGAGSGEFHVYKASRRREYERLRLMDEEVEREVGEREFEAKRAETKKQEDDKLSKNQAKRAKAKLRQERKKKGAGGVGEGMEVDGDGKAGGESNGVVGKKRLGAAKVATSSGQQGGDGAVEVNGDAEAVGEEGGGGGGITFHDDDDD